MVRRMPQKPVEGTHIKMTADFEIWKKDFDKMTLKDHENKLKELGLDEEDIKEFDEDFQESHLQDKPVLNENKKKK